MIKSSTLRAIVERITELEWHSEGNKLRLFVFEQLGQDGRPYKTWIQNWVTDDITDQFSLKEQDEIYDTVKEYYKCKATSKE